jgi:uncharacterized membrane protein
MGTKTFEIPVIVALLTFLAINYALGYWLGIGLTGSVLIALVIAFVLPCLGMIGFMLIVPLRRRSGGQTRFG